MWRSILVVSVLSAACSFEPAGTQPGELDATVDTAPAIDAGPSVAPPQAYWSFDTDARDQVGPHHGTLIGTAQISAGTSGYRGEALRLATEGDRVDVDLPSALDFNRDFTWHLYVRTTDGSGALLSRNPAGRAWNQGSKAMFVRSDTVQWDSGWVSNPQTQVEIDDGTWHQVIATYVAATDSLDVFVDPAVGAIAGQYSGTHDVNKYDEHTHLHNGGIADTGFSIGAANFTGGLSDLGTLIGAIDEVAVFDRALRGSELELLVRSGPAAFAP